MTTTTIHFVDHTTRRTAQHELLFPIDVADGTRDVYVEAYTAQGGENTVRQLTTDEFDGPDRAAADSLFADRRAAMAEAADGQTQTHDPAPQLATRQLEDVNVIPLYGDSLLNGYGIGAVDFNGTALHELRCGIFVAGARPTVGREYIITGTYSEVPRTPFRFTLSCTIAGVRSHFA